MKGTLIAAGSIIGLVALGAQQTHARAAEVEIEGPVREVSGTCPNLEFKVGEQRVTTHSETEFEDGRCEDVTEGRRVEVEGRVDEEGKLEAREVDLD